ncbi:hypothetical protein U2F26_35205 [Micromonospora sp. 4G57]|uniref:Uncharacterized protein n=1 Tax=Micromonospora sicca TaxID=2202420 RepID=A0ABU5JPV5_9ACTN|nr:MULTISPECIES: hypothetical protein [unclassified Micromonospora]MDZ5447885.1 hypothetical protein [Micromonospora sp. 4G57]MDZ5494631.1 hypothetical protein [Micromonospora sp. 4G53]
MSHQDVAGDMDAWSSARVRQWMSTLSEDDAPRSVNWWLKTRWIAQLHVYDRALTAEARREWAEVALSLTDRAERFAGYDRWSAAADSFNLRSRLIQELGSVPGDENWDQAALVRSVLGAVTLMPAQANELAESWQTLPIEHILLLRRHKNLVAPLAPLVDQLPARPDAERVRTWLAILPNLP